MLGDFILALPILVFSLVAHEYAHAVVAYHQGDDTAYLLGRITLNPLPHLDPFLSILMPALTWFISSQAFGYPFVFGGAKPVPVDPRKYRNYVRGDLLVSSAGVITNFVLSFVFALLFMVIGLVGRGTGGSSVLEAIQRMCMYGMWLNLFLCFFNLIPVPPLDGSHVLYHLLPRAWAERYRSLHNFGLLPIFALMFLFRPVFRVLLTPAFFMMNLQVHLVLPFAIGNGWNIFT